MPKLCSDPSVRLGYIAEKQVPAKLKPIVVCSIALTPKVINISKKLGLTHNLWYFKIFNFHQDKRMISGNQQLKCNETPLHCTLYNIYIIKRQALAGNTYTATPLTSNFWKIEKFQGFFYSRSPLPAFFFTIFRTVWGYRSLYCPPTGIPKYFW